MMKLFLRYLLYLFVTLGFSSAAAGAYEDYFHAIEVDDAATVKSLLGRGFDPNTPDPQGQLGLFLALRAGSLQAAGLLLGHPALKIDATNLHGETPVMMAALRGRADWVQRMAERGAKVDRDGWTPLQYAAAGPSVEAVAALLDLGARVDAKSPTGATALMMAAQYGNERSVDLLLARGADPRAQDAAGSRAADYARRGSRESLANRLSALSR